MPFTPRPARWALWMLPLAAVVSLGAAADPPLVEAVKNRNAQAVRALLQQRADINAPEPDGATPLLWAAHWDDLGVADLLIGAGAKVDAANDYGVTPLSLAATNGSLAMVGKLLKAGASANTALPSGETVLMTAARTGTVDAVRALLAAGAQVDATEKEKGQTALMWAAAEGHAAVVQLLIQHGANASARSAAGYTPLIFAARGGDQETASMLLAAKANVNEAAGDGTAPLLMALVRGHVSLAEFLLGQGADPNAEGTGYNALQWASGSWETQMRFSNHAESLLSEWHSLTGLKGQRKLDMMKALLAHGAEVNARTKKPPPRFGMFVGVGLKGATPFAIAASAADTKAMTLLLAAGADPRLPTDDGLTPLMLAAGVSRTPGQDQVDEDAALEAVKLVMELGPGVNAVSEQNYTALHAAAYWGFNSVVQFLVDKGGDFTIKTKDGHGTPLAIAEGRVGFRSMVFYRYPLTAALLRKLGAVD